MIGLHGDDRIATVMEGGAGPARLHKKDERA
jgi:hypothetical protein